MYHLYFQPPKELVKDLNRLLFKFLWKSTDKVTRASTINDFEHGGLRMIDTDSVIVSLRLAWLKRIFNENGGTWKSYLCYLLECFGGLFFIYCKYDLKIIQQFLNSIMNFGVGGDIFETPLIQNVIGVI